MRILQIIDSLDPGGAEKMAVSYANSLSEKIEFSGLIATRKEGDLKLLINQNVQYLFLNKRFSLDYKAVLKLRHYCIDNRVQIIHAHSSSYFISCLIKILVPKINLIWHDHNGVGNIPKKDGTLYLQLFSMFFKGIISVNMQLKIWAKKNLFCNNVVYLANYVVENSNYQKQTILKGQTGKRVLYLANLRYQKNHFMLIEVVKKIRIDFPDWTYHLVGMDFKDNYSSDIKKAIKINNLNDVIFLYGSCQDIENIIIQSDIAVFTSNSEGLPVALLEYGLYKKPVVSTRAGQIPFIVQHNKCGFISEVKDVDQFSTNLSKLIQDDQLRIKFGEEINKVIIENYSEEFVINYYILWLNKIGIYAK
jgi:glycosyltransferase involved in cell wall biosynthesis